MSPAFEDLTSSPCKGWGGGTQHANGGEVYSNEGMNSISWQRGGEADELCLSRKMVLREAFSSGHRGSNRMQKVGEAVDCEPELKALSCCYHPNGLESGLAFVDLLMLHAALEGLDVSGNILIRSLEKRREQRK